MKIPIIKTIYGVDFSGGAQAGDNIWIATAQPARAKLQLVQLNRLTDLAGAAEREIAMAKLVELIAASKQSLWGIDFPFGLPIELAAMGISWQEQLQFVRYFNGGAKEFGRWCVDQALTVGDKLHIRRCTDTETKTPFDCYHYRIIYQTFHGMRDMLLPLNIASVAVLPFQYDRLRRAKTVVVEACPSSTLKRLQLPHQNYKQPAGGALLAKRRRTRRVILAALEKFISIDNAQRRIIMRNPGGDALDAVIAAVGTWQAFGGVDHVAIAAHDRYPREGRVYA